MSSEKTKFEKVQKGNKLMLIVSVIVVVIAIIGIGILLLGRHVGITASTKTSTTYTHTMTTETEHMSETYTKSYTSTTTVTKRVEEGQLTPLMQMANHTRVKNVVLRIRLNEFEVLKNVTLVSPLTPPDENGVFFVVIKTDLGANKLITYKDGKPIGSIDLTPEMIPIMDPRSLSYQTYKGKLLVQINNTLYALYGDKLEKLYQLNVTGMSSYFVKDGKIYAWNVRVWKEGNVTYGSCAYYDMSDGGKKVAEYDFDFGNVSAANVLPDAIDGEGCIGMYATSGNPVVHYWYKGKEGEAKMELSIASLQITTQGPMFLEKSYGTTEPYVLYVQRATQDFHAFVMNMVNMVTKKNVTAIVPGLYSLLGMGDFEGKGYINSISLIALGPKGFTLMFVGNDGWKKELNLGALSKSYAWIQGVVNVKGKKYNLLALGNLTSNDVVLNSNVGGIEITIGKVPVKGVSLTMLVRDYGNELCYSAAIVPKVGGLISQGTQTSGKSYLSYGCFAK